MAGDWIKWTKGLAKRPEVLQMAALMGRSRHEVAGLLMEFWEWADDNVMPADESAICPGFVRIPSASELLVDTLAGADGFANSLAAVGWIVIRDGAIEFPKFGRHNGKSGKRRALDAERKRTDRDQRQDSVRNMSASDADKKRTREEKRRTNKPRGQVQSFAEGKLPDTNAVLGWFTANAERLGMDANDYETRVRVVACAEKAIGGAKPGGLFVGTLKRLGAGETVILSEFIPKARERLKAFDARHSSNGAAASVAATLGVKDGE